MSAIFGQDFHFIIHPVKRLIFLARAEFVHEIISSGTFPSQITQPFYCYIVTTQMMESQQILDQTVIETSQPIPSRADEPNTASMKKSTPSKS